MIENYQKSIRIRHLPFRQPSRYVSHYGKDNMGWSAWGELGNLTTPMLSFENGSADGRSAGTGVRGQNGLEKSLLPWDEVKALGIPGRHPKTCRAPLRRSEENQLPY